MDNDANATYSNGSPSPNWGQEAALSFKTKYTAQGYVTINEKSEGKDVNEDLLISICTSDSKYIYKSPAEIGANTDDTPYE